MPAGHALISLLALGGLRVSEATGANIEALGIDRGHLTLVITRKGGKVVTVPLAPRTARAIDLAVSGRAEGPIFLASDGQRLDRHGAPRIVRRRASRARITKPVGLHTLRHAFITAAFDAGVPLRDVQEAASHANPPLSSTATSRPDGKVHRSPYPLPHRGVGLGWCWFTGHGMQGGFVTAHGGGAAAQGALTLPPPQLSFACELDSARLAELFADPQVIYDLQALKARVALMCSDFSDERAGVVRRLNAAGVPVTGIPLLPPAEGYYFTTDNAGQAVGSYQQFMAWTGRHELVWDGVGLDIEPDARIFLQITKAPWGLVPMLAPRLLDRARPGRAKAAYRALVQQIRADGWLVENYQFPLIADERQAGSTVLQRLALVDVATDREVWMLYSSFLRAVGSGLIWAYGPEAAAIAVGTTGGVPDIPGSPQMPTLNWEELVGDLRLARHFCDQILIHSLEGCVWQGFLPRLRSFEWADVEGPPVGAQAAVALRKGLRATLWTSAHPWPVLGFIAATAWLAWRWRRE